MAGNTVISYGRWGFVALKRVTAEMLDNIFFVTITTTTINTTVVVSQGCGGEGASILQ